MATVRVDDGTGEIISYPGIGLLVGAGATVPADNAVGWSHGAIFANTDGTTSVDAVYINIGTSAAANFDPLDTAAGDGTLIGDTVSESTAGAGVTVDGLLIKDGNVDIGGTAGTGKLLISPDGQTYIVAGGVEDQIEVYINNLANFVFAPNTFTATSGSAFSTDTITEATAAVGVAVDGAVIRDGMFLGVQVTPTAETGVATITIADILTGIVTLEHTVGATVALTLDTGVAMDIGKPSSLGANGYIDWSLINISAAALDSGTVTASAGHTIVGVAVVQSAHATTGGLYGNAGRFRSRRTAADTWVTYRLA